MSILLYMTMWQAGPQWPAQGRGAPVFQGRLCTAKTVINTFQLTVHGAAAAVTLPVSTVASKQLPDVAVVRMHNVPGGLLLLTCIVWHAVSCVEIVAQRRVRLPSSDAPVEQRLVFWRKVWWQSDRSCRTTSLAPPSNSLFQYKRIHEVLMQG
jgi:hypothetical protein